MKSALILLAFSTLVLAMFGGFDSSPTGQYVSSAKQRAIDNVQALSEIDVMVMEEDFIIDTSRLFDYEGVPVLISGREAEFVLDFSFLGESAFSRIESYIDYSHFTAFLEVSEGVIESEVVPTGFLEYKVGFSIPEGYTGLGCVGYKTRGWSKSRTVFVSESSSVSSLNELVINTL